MSEPLARILVADDEADLRALLQRYLSDQGYAVRTVDGAGPLDKLLARERFDVLVLDVMMPGEDGLSVCRRLRAQGETIPIVMLTARGDPLDRIIGLEMGADDYLPKPFNPRELLATDPGAGAAPACARRARRPGARGRDDPLRRAPAAHRRTPARTRWAATCRSPAASSRCCRRWRSNPNRPLGRDRLIELAHGRDHEATDRSIDVQVMRLRKLIEADPAKPRHIQTVWGVGYVFVPESRSETASK